MKLAMITALGVLLGLGPAAEPEKVDFATLAGFEYEEGMQLPAEITRLDQREVIVSGFMQREDDGDGPVEFFMLVNDACGCEGTPKLNEIVFCAMPEGETTDIREGTVEIEGVLYVGEEVDEDVVVALYALDVTRFR